jgi:type 1 glutamine amidotransferase
MKFTITLFALILSACSSQLSTVASEEVTTNARSFEYVPSPSVLIFSETRDWRHEEGIAGASLAIIKAAKEMGHGYFSTEHSGVFNNKDLERFDVVVFNNMTGDALTPAQEAAFVRWQAKGHGTVLIHGAGDDSHQDWSYYHQELIGATFVSHPMAPQLQEARVEVLAPSHPVMLGIPNTFTAFDEWYTFEAPPNGNFTVLAGLDESTYSPVNTVYGDRSDLRMGPTPAEHPIIWTRCNGANNARSVFTAMGHSHEIYEAKEASLILKNALNWVAKKTDPQSIGCSEK